jgi:hypothetical protein
MREPVEQNPQVNSLKEATQLNENDFLKLRLMNRNVELFELQVELSGAKLREAARMLMDLSQEVAERYNLKDHRQVNMQTGVIERDLTKIAGVPNVQQG